MVFIKKKEKIVKMESDNSTEASFYSQTYRNFDIKFEGVEHWSNISKVMWILESAYSDLFEAFDWVPKTHVVVIIYTGDKFRNVTNTPDWTAGLDDGKIRIMQGQVEGDKDILKKILYVS